MKRPVFYFLVLVFLCLVSISCSNGEANDAPEMDRRTRIKLKQYAVHGRKLYQKHCSNCHQEDGTGLRRVIPPLRGSDYLIPDHVPQVVCIIKHGTNKNLVVNGITYQQAMPANEGLTPLEIAEITTYVYNDFGDRHTLISVKEVDQILKDCREK